MVNIKEQKQQLRQSLKAMRLAMPAEEVEQRSLQICRLAEPALDWKKVKLLHVYTPLPHLKEVDSWPLIKYLWQKYPGLKMAAVSAQRRGENKAVWINPSTKWRGLVPDSRLRVPADTLFDAVLVPALGFDQRLHRLGWGGGWYDKFLANQPQALKIGLCYEQGHLKSLPAEPHDIALDLIITQRKVYSSS